MSVNVSSEYNTSCEEDKLSSSINDITNHSLPEVIESRPRRIIHHRTIRYDEWSLTPECPRVVHRCYFSRCHVGEMEKDEPTRSYYYDLNGKHSSIPEMEIDQLTEMLGLKYNPELVGKDNNMLTSQQGKLDYSRVYIVDDLQ